MNVLRFNVLVLENKTNNDPIYMIEALKHWYNKEFLLSRNYKGYKPLKVSLHGSGYLLNPEAFFNNTADVLFKAQYLKLAGRRDYGEFKTMGISYLDLTYFSDLNIEAVKSNPLLKIENNKIYFKLEKE